MRLDKLLSETDFGTRSQVKKLIRQGKVTVNEQVADAPQMQVDPQTDHVVCEGKEVEYRKFSYFLFYKPGGCVTARTDDTHKTVMDYVKEPIRNLSPVGRLDLDTEGLLLITNDGALAHNLLSPAKHVSKTYEAVIDGCVTEDDVTAFREGLDIGDPRKTAPAELCIRQAGKTSQITVTITEGRFHQVKRMFQAVGKEVLFLKRVRMGTLTLPEEMKPGEYRHLTEEEIQALSVCTYKKAMEETDVKRDQGCPV